MDSAELNFILYKVVCQATGKAYIGQTRKRMGWRWAQHVYTANKNGRGCPALHAAIRKYGRDAFSLTELGKFATVEDANVAELQLIACHGTLAPGGYNLAVGGNESTRTEATRQKISAAHMGKPKPWSSGHRSHQTCEAISRGKQGKQPRGTGWTHSPETIAKMRASHQRRHANGLG